MARKPAPTTPAKQQQPSPATPPTMRTIEPNMVATLTEWGDFLGLPRYCLRREARLNRLTTYRRAGKLWSDGASVLDWLHGGRVRRPRAAAEAADDDLGTAARAG
jgi:hypothetical protein